MQFIKIHPSMYSDNTILSLITLRQNKYSSYTSAITKLLSKGRIGERSGKRSVVPTPVKALSVLFINMSKDKGNLSTANTAMALESHVHVSVTHA